MTTGNSNYITYASPTFDPTDPGSAEIALRINGVTSGVEPSTWAMQLLGLAGVGYAASAAHQRLASHSGEARRREGSGQLSFRHSCLQDAATASATW